MVIHYMSVVRSSKNIVLSVYKYTRAHELNVTLDRVNKPKIPPFYTYVSFTFCRVAFPLNYNTDVSKINIIIITIDILRYTYYIINKTYTTRTTDNIIRCLYYLLLHNVHATTYV